MPATVPALPAASAHYLSVGLAFAVGILLLAMGTPRFAAALASDPERIVFDALAQHRPVPAAEFDRASEALIAAVEWHANPADAARLGALRLAEAHLSGIGPEKRRQLLELSIRTNRWSLAQKPVQVFAWMNLALATAELGTAGADLDPLLRMAIRTGPYEPTLVIPRLELAFAVDSQLSEETRSLVRQQIRAAAFYEPEALVAFARQRNAVPAILDALAEDDNLLLRFQTAYFRL